jgi:pimeloyl-ACP methyl ester carboxylesterase
MRSLINRTAHAGMDAIVCAMMNTVQWRLRHHAITSERLEEYLLECQDQDHQTYYSTPDENRTLNPPEWRREGHRLFWKTARKSDYPENNTVCAHLFETTHFNSPDDAPTIILVHALMSANDSGYQQIASRFNKEGWNVLFPHLPYHYSRRPRGYANGALTITSDLIRNAETLRQSVIELRQLIAWSRQQGSRRIALLATSYGAWVTSLVLSLEKTDFTILIQPVVDVKHATFESPASRMMARSLKRNNIYPEAIDRHAHLSSPSRLIPLTPLDRITIIGGKYDRLSSTASLKKLCQSWGGAKYLEVDQGHFGYAAMRSALQESEQYMNHPIMSESE